jgi:transcriptional regulator with XRE-family HTH domain
MPSANDTKAFGTRFRQAMLRKGYGQLGATELAEVLATEFPDGLSIQSVHKWVAGTAVPRPDRLAVLARWLDVSEHWLRFGPDPKGSNRLTGGADRPLSAKDLARRLQALSEGQREIVEALLLEFEKTPQE